MPRRIGWKRLVGVAAFAVPFVAVVTAVLVSAAPGRGVTAADALPNLVSDPPGAGTIETYVEPSGSRLLLRFDGYVHNDGLGALELWGKTPLAGGMTATYQTIYGASGMTSRDDPSGGARFVFETADGHNHWHLISAMRYGLYDATRTTLVAPAMKVGFCLIDSERVGEQGPMEKAYRLGSFCGQGSPAAAEVSMGISAGWRDIYNARLAFQWVDVSDVTPGRYWLGADSDPDGHIIESDETDNGTAFAVAESVVPGWVARPLAVSRQAGPATIALAADAYGTPGAVTYRIEQPPAHGTLSVDTGQDVGGDTVVYTPAPGYEGADSFTYSARDGGSAFPRHPVMATVSVTRTPGSLSIAAAPPTVVAGTGAQLTALVSGDPPGVTWSVEGIVGGNAVVGTISATGLYSAPATVPPGGEVRVRAASATASDETVIAIVPPTPPQPAPAAGPPPAGGGGGGGGGGGAPPDVSLTMTADRPVAVTGETVLFRLTARLANAGRTSGTTGTVVVDTLPPGLDLVSTKVNRGSGCTGDRIVVCQLDFLSGDIVGEVEITARVTASGPLVNSASVEVTPSDPVLQNNVATVGLAGPAAPLTPPAARPRPRVRAPLQAIEIGRLGRRLLVTGRAVNGGRVDVTAGAAARKLGACALRAPAGRRFTCVVQLPGGVDLRGVTVEVRLLATRQVIDRRRIVLDHLRGVSRDGVESWAPASSSPGRG